MSKNNNPIEEYFTKNSSEMNSRNSELFKGNDEFIDQMTELTHNEIRNVLTLTHNDMYLKKFNIKPVFSDFAHKFMRLQVSKDRKSRQEFVEVNKKDEEEKGSNISLVGSLQ